MSVIGVEVVGCNIPVFVNIDTTIIFFGLYDQDWRCMQRMYIVSIQQLITATKGVNSSYTMDISSRTRQSSSSHLNRRIEHTLIASH